VLQQPCTIVNTRILQMTVTFENDINIIVYAQDQVIAYDRRIEQIVVAQCIWWLASVWGLEEGLIVHIDNLAGKFPEKLTQD